MENLLGPAIMEKWRNLSLRTMNLWRLPPSRGLCLNSGSSNISLIYSQIFYNYTKYMSMHTFYILPSHRFLSRRYNRIFSIIIRFSTFSDMSNYPFLTVHSLIELTDHKTWATQSQALSARHLKSLTNTNNTSRTNRLVLKNKQKHVLELLGTWVVN